MATFNKINQFPEWLAEKVFNLGSDQLTVALTNSAPTSGSSVLSQISEISYTNLSSRNITTSASAQSSGVYKLTLTDLTLTASGGSVGPFRYVVIYDDTPTSPADPVMCYFDFGSALTLQDGDSLLIDFDGSNGLLQIS